MVGLKCKSRQLGISWYLAITRNWSTCCSCRGLFGSQTKVSSLARSLSSWSPTSIFTKTTFALKIIWGEKYVCTVNYWNNSCELNKISIILKPYNNYYFYQDNIHINNNLGQKTIRICVLLISEITLVLIYKFERYSCELIVKEGDFTK